MIEESRFYQAVRKYVVTAPTWASDLIEREVLPDEQYDLTLVAYRVYGSRHEYLAVMAAAGLDRVRQRLPAGTVLRLPNAQRLGMLKAATGYSSTVRKSVR